MALSHDESVADAADSRAAMQGQRRQVVRCGGRHGGLGASGVGRRNFSFASSYAARHWPPCRNAANTCADETRRPEQRFSPKTVSLQDHGSHTSSAAMHRDRRPKWGGKDHVRTRVPPRRCDRSELRECGSHCRRIVPAAPRGRRDHGSENFPDRTRSIGSRPAGFCVRNDHERTRLCRPTSSLEDRWLPRRSRFPPTFVADDRAATDRGEGATRWARCATKRCLEAVCSGMEKFPVHIPAARARVGCV
jgi:hypothetical protein